MDAWANDLEIPGRYGIVMHVGDSIGPGGIMRAFRNAPALAQVARNAAEVAPDAYIFNYTNPAPIEALAMRTAAPGVKSFGLCSCAAHASSREWLASQAGVKPEQIAMPPVVAGINHCASIQSLRLLDGTDAMPRVLARATQPVVKWALETYGVLPYCWTHWTEFFPQMQRLEEPYSGTAQGVKMRYGIETHDMDYERARVARARGPRRDLDGARRRSDHARRPAGRRRGRGHRGDRHHRVHRHQRQHHARRDRTQQRARSRICPTPRSSRSTPRSTPTAYGRSTPARCPRRSRRTCATTSSFQQHVVKAALSGDRKAALHAFLLDPTTQAHLDLDQTQALLDEMLEANRQYLPLFQR